MTVYTDEEKAAPARGVTPDEIAYRRNFPQPRQDPNATLWTPINPRGIVTIPRKLPLGIRQLVSLVLVLLFFAILLVGRTGYFTLWLLFLPLRMSQKRHHPDEYAAATNNKVRRDVFMSALPPQGEMPEGGGPMSPRRVPLPVSGRPIIRHRPPG